MTAALEAVDRDGVAANALRLQGMANGGALVNDLDSRILEPRQMVLGIAAGGLDDRHASVDDGVDIARIVRRLDYRQDGEVDAERLVGHVVATGDLVGQIGWRLLG